MSLDDVSRTLILNKGKKMLVNWVDDEAAYVVLNDMGILSGRCDIKVAEINRKLSGENRARKVPLDESRVEGIKAAIGKGVPIPKITVRRTGSNEYVIVGGNHRFASINGEVLLPVHVIECSDSEFEVAVRVLNTVVGIGITKDERIESAVDAVQRLGMSQTAAASAYGISISSVSRAVMEKTIERRVYAVAPKLAKKVKKTHLKLIGELVNNDNILRAACAMVAETGVSTKEFAEVVNLAKSKSTEAAQVAVFESEFKMRSGQDEKTVPRRARSRFLSALTSIRGFSGNTTWSSLEIEPSEIVLLKTQVAEALRILNCLSKASG